MEHLQQESRCFPPSPSFAKKALVGNEKAYEELYHHSLEKGAAFWLEQAKTLDWIKPPTKAGRWQWDTEKRIAEHTWFEDGQLNVAANCLDRHAEGKRGDALALLWQGEKEEEERSFTFRELLAEVCRFANLLKAKGIKKGDRVCIYMPMIPEIACAMLACARIGAIHTVVFGGFSAESLAQRINDAGCKGVITANASVRGGKLIPFKEIVDRAVVKTPSIEWVCVVKREESSCTLQEKRDFWYQEEMAKQSEVCPPEPLSAEDPLFILYTSGSTGKPKGVVHTQGGYLLWASLTHKYVFDAKDEDLFWCTADCGWITGHTYSLYGPLCNGKATLFFEGVPTYPDAGRFWRVIDKHKVTVFYTAPTAIRTLIHAGRALPATYDLSSLRLLGTVGEPIHPETWLWYYEEVGKKRCPIVDTWWQTETGGILISALPGCHTLKPGSACRPLFGVEPLLLNKEGLPCSREEGGYLCLRAPWPGLARTMWKNHDKWIDTYFSRFPNVYFTGDSALCDKEGDFWLLGRVDDVVNISGHRLGTAEIEGALVSHPAVVEAAVVPVEDEIRGQALSAFVTLRPREKENSSLTEALIAHVKQVIGPIVHIKKLQFTKSLPKTRSGKIMRRILRKIAAGETEDLGDLSTLADKKVIQELL